MRAKQWVLPFFQSTGGEAVRRYMDMDQISDGRRYRRQDLVKLGCQECEGCSACCHQMVEIPLDPWDLYMLYTHQDETMQELFTQKLALQAVDGLVLPVLRMDGPREACRFLNDQGRCSIHAFRPGICRLFPLGRIYEEDGFSYFLQVDECRKTNRTKVKIEKWLGIPNLAAYEKFVVSWHEVLENVRASREDLDADLFKMVNTRLLQTFLLTPYQQEDFYEQFSERLHRWQSM